MVDGGNRRNGAACVPGFGRGGVLCKGLGVARVTDVPFKAAVKLPDVQ